MIRCSVHDNVAGSRGGGVFCQGNLTLVKTEITHNKAQADSDVSKFTGCHITNNTVMDAVKPLGKDHIFM